MDRISSDSSIIDLPKDEACIDMTKSIAYSYFQMIGPTGPEGIPGVGLRGLRGITGSTGHHGEDGRDAPIIPSMTERICDTSLPFYPVMFHFPIQSGGFDPHNNMTNSLNDDLVDRINAFGIRFHINAFVRIEIKIYTIDTKSVMLTDHSNRIIDIGNGPCINLKWIGYINYGTNFFIIGGVDQTTDGYWNINII